MKRNVLAFVLIGGLLASGVCARAAGGSSGGAGPQSSTSQLVTEGDFAKWLVNVLGLTRSLPVGPTEQQCFAALLQNSVTPKAGWNSTNLVTMGTLARVVTQALHTQSEVQNPDDDNSWIQHLKAMGIDFGKCSEAGS